VYASTGLGVLIKIQLQSGVSRYVLKTSKTKKIILFFRRNRIKNNTKQINCPVNSKKLDIFPSVLLNSLHLFQIYIEKIRIFKKIFMKKAMRYSRILLKLSGEALSGKGNYGISDAVLDKYAKEVMEVVEKGCEVAIVIGGGNIFRGLSGSESGFDRVKGDQMGMLATVINSLALESAFSRLGGSAKVFTSIRMEPVGELYNRDKVVDAMNHKTVCILSGGTGNPFFTTDTASALRAVEIGADVLLKGTRVDGVYTSDPEKDPKAEKFDKISFEEVIKRRLKVMDSTAFTMCRENNMPVIVFDMNKSGNLNKLVEGENIGTIVSN
jgi:uridylate kinase